ncbi:FAD binding domain-containing protein [Scheffersomyces amazonensis]|uniref:FAD binding domain-containing protein n=1 Tax=Scheffersomyces amazonensis TaxID=1078765 RepID=UPI00315DA4AA
MFLGARPTTAVIGTGLAGLSTTLNLLEKGYNVVLIEKTDKIGGNSIKASSGINGVLTKFQPPGDSFGSFISDTIDSGKGLCNTELVSTLAENSKVAVEKLTDKYGIDLSKVTQLGGHSHARTHRGGGKLPPGFAIISSLQKQLELPEYNNRLTIIKNARFDKFIVENKAVVGLEYLLQLEDNARKQLLVDNIVLATGGYSADFDPSGLLLKNRPDVKHLASTNGIQTTGDGQKIALRDLDAKLIHLDKVQIHPTGFINRKNVNDKWKFLCGELLRGIGGILVNPNTGTRFVNELSTRDVVTDAIFKNCKISQGNKLDLEEDTAVSVILINEQDYSKADSHIDFYKSQGLLNLGNYGDVFKLVQELNPVFNIPKEEYGKLFNNYNEDFNMNKQVYYGLITPVLHFTMGGIQIDVNGNVINKLDQIIPNVYAVGEVSGGVHGANRLGGSSLLECVVFGQVVANSIINSSKA